MLPINWFYWFLTEQKLVNCITVRSKSGSFLMTEEELDWSFGWTLGSMEIILMPQAGFTQLLKPTQSNQSLVIDPQGYWYTSWNLTLEACWMGFTWWLSASNMPTTWQVLCKLIILFFKFKILSSFLLIYIQLNIKYHSFGLNSVFSLIFTLMLDYGKTIAFFFHLSSPSF